ncbi:MAG: hypothetical protein R2726_05235 [Acidimicrobiales bacterium]
MANVLYFLPWLVGYFGWDRRGGGYRERDDEVLAPVAIVLSCWPRPPVCGAALLLQSTRPPGGPPPPTADGRSTACERGGSDRLVGPTSSLVMAGVHRSDGLHDGGGGESYDGWLVRRRRFAGDRGEDVGQQARRACAARRRCGPWHSSRHRPRDRADQHLVVGGRPLVPRSGASVMLQLSPRSLPLASTASSTTSKSQGGGGLGAWMASTISIDRELKYCMSIAMPPLDAVPSHMFRLKPGPVPGKLKNALIGQVDEDRVTANLKRATWGGMTQYRYGE